MMRIEDSLNLGSSGRSGKGLGVWVMEEAVEMDLLQRNKIWDGAVVVVLGKSGRGSGFWERE